MDSPPLELNLVQGGDPSEQEIYNYTDRGSPTRLNLVQGGDPSEGGSYRDVAYSDISYVEIFPPVGISRFGDSEKEYFLAPEVPGRTDPPAGITNFRDSDQKIRRQAVRFRVYAYKADGTPLGEINNKVKYNSSQKYSLKWTVHVANKKAANTTFHGRHASPPITALRNPNVQANLELDKRTNLIVDPKEKKFPPESGSSNFVNLQGEFWGSRAVKTDVYLGQLQADNAGRLIFVPGTGHAKSVLDPNNTQPEIISEFDSTDWIDTACDGWVKVEVTADTNMKTSQHYATVVSGPPNFAWGINAPTTLYNIMEYIYWHKAGEPASGAQYDFSKDIWPVLNSAASASWTNNTALQGHGPSSNGHFSSDAVINILKGSDATKRNDLKTRIFERLRKPDYKDPSQADARFMPRLSGDNGDMPDPGTFPSRLQPDIKRFAALTKLQYERFRTWKNDGQALPPTWSPEPTQKKLEDVVNKKDQPDFLTRAILESTVGDPLLPGIEMYWSAKSSSVYDFRASTLVLKPPFRVNHGDPTQLPGPNYDQPIKPGHLTRGLSLPWQCDFMLCETHWWPHIRPDNVVPKAVYENTMGKSGAHEQFDTATRMRSLWTRGFRAHIGLGQTRTTTDIPWFASTDMVRFWNYLGIVRKHKKTYPERREITAYVESERLEL
ncbi:L-lysine 6-oxidase [Leucoagaricus sp. SymC.cos]|nr:L-lysine 6-oxidase [Leucoagaricus sp. SymC.cos]